MLKHLLLRTAAAALIAAAAVSARALAAPLEVGATSAPACVASAAQGASMRSGVRADARARLIAAESPGSQVLAENRRADSPRIRGGSSSYGPGSLRCRASVAAASRACSAPFVHPTFAAADALARAGLVASGKTALPPPLP